jgi:hypothetical protein
MSGVPKKTKKQKKTKTKYKYFASSIPKWGEAPDLL